MDKKSKYGLIFLQNRLMAFFYFSARTKDTHKHRQTLGKWAQAHWQSGYLKGLQATCQAASKKTFLSYIGANSKVHHLLHKACIFRKRGTDIQPTIHILQNSKHGVNLSAKWNKTFKHTLFFQVWSYSAKYLQACRHISVIVVPKSCPQEVTQSHIWPKYANLY